MFLYSSIVEEVTDDKKLTRAERKQAQIDHSPFISKEAKLVKLADKLYNLRDCLRVTPIGWNEQIIQEYFDWSGQVIRGMKGTNESMEQELAQVLLKRNVLI